MAFGQILGFLRLFLGRISGKVFFTPLVNVGWMQSTTEIPLQNLPMTSPHPTNQTNTPNARPLPKNLAPMFWYLLEFDVRTRTTDGGVHPESCLSIVQDSAEILCNSLRPIFTKFDFPFHSDSRSLQCQKNLMARNGAQAAPENKPLNSCGEHHLQ